jgi:hypothetical protein
VNFRATSALVPLFVQETSTDPVADRYEKMPAIRLCKNRPVDLQVRGFCEKCGGMVNEDKIDDVVLALLQLTAHGEEGAMRAWKGQSWDVMDRLYEKGWISDPKGKAKSVRFTEEGWKRSQQLFERLFEDDAS